MIATKPTTAPIHAPIAETLRPLILSKSIHVIIPEAEAIVVVPKAKAAVAFAPKAEPALKPNHPNHNIPVPSITNGIFAGLCSLFLRLPITKAPANAANPALI